MSGTVRIYCLPKTDGHLLSAVVPKLSTTFNGMKYPVNLNAISSKVEFYAEVIEMNEKASDYLLSFDWCSEIKSSSIYLNLGSKLCVFLFEIENIASAGTITNAYIFSVLGGVPVYIDPSGQFLKYDETFGPLMTAIYLPVGDIAEL